MTYRFCPNCGSNIAYSTEVEPALVAIPIGAFADPAFPIPNASYNERRRHRWAVIDADGATHAD